MLHQPLSYWKIYILRAVSFLPEMTEDIALLLKK